MTYLLQCFDQNLSSGQLNTMIPVDIYYNLNKGIKYISFSITAPDNGDFSLVSYTPPAWASECATTNEEISGSPLSQKITVTLTVDTRTDIYAGTYNDSDVLAYAGSVLIVPVTDNVNNYLELNANNTLFPGEINSYALIHNDGEQVASDQFLINNGMVSVGGDAACTITDITVSDSTITTNEAVTFTGIVTDVGRNYWRWDFGADVIYVSNPNSLNITVKFKRPGTYSATLIGTAGNGISYPFTVNNIVAVTAASPAGVNETIDFYPNINTDPDRLDSLYAPALVGFLANITGVYQLITWNVYDKAKLVVEGGGQTPIYTELNTAFIFYTFQTPNTYTIELNVKYSESLTKTVRYEYTVQAYDFDFSGMAFTPSEGNSPLTITLDATAVSDRTNISRYVWEAGVNGMFPLDALPAEQRISAINLYFAYGYGGLYNLIAGDSDSVIPETETAVLTDSGLYSLRLHYWDLNMEYSYHTFNDAVLVNPYGTPIVSFINGITYDENPDIGNVPWTLYVDATATLYATTLEWNFGDGTVISGTFENMKNQTHTYTIPGVYNVTLTATNEVGTQSYTINALAIMLDENVPYIRNLMLSDRDGGGDPPVPFTLGWNADETEYYGIAPEGITLNIYQWNATEITIFWGDGTSDIYTEFLGGGNHTYSETGTYEITVVAKKGLTEVQRTLGPIYIYTAPVANFTVNDTTINAGDTVSFTDLSLNNPISWLWNFGDGTTSTEQHPSHTYLIDGVFPVSLEVTNYAGSDKKLQTAYITVGIGANLDGDFSADQTVFLFDSNPSVMVQFTYTEEEIAGYQYIWDYGDGTGAIGFNPGHIYSKYGKFNVSLTIKHLASGVMRTITKPQYITITESNAPTPDFDIITPSTGNVPLEVIILPRCTGAIPTQYRVNFGDDPYYMTYQADTIQTIKHVYNSVGIYTITFIAANEYGSKEIKKVDCVSVLLEVPVPPVSLSPIVRSWYDASTPLKGEAPLTINFVDNTTEFNGETFISWYWTFGDGTSSNEKNPTHTYDNPGTYYVMLNVTTQSGNSFRAEYPLIVQATAAISVDTDVVPNFDSYIKSGSAPFTTTIFSTSTGDPTEFAWLFGDEPDGTPFPSFDSTKSVVTHTYAESGIYKVQLKAKNALGEVSVAKDAFIIVSEPVTQLASYTSSKPNVIGDMVVPAIHAINPTGLSRVEVVENVNTLDSYAYSIPSTIEDLTIEGTLFNDGKGEDDYAEDIMSLRLRSGAYNHFELAGQRGFLIISDVNVPKEANTQTLREFSIDCKFESATLFERAYTIETSIYNSVINGFTYTVDHPPSIALPVNAFNVKVKSPWQTISLKQPTYEMISSEGKIPIYMPFKLLTADDTTFKTYNTVSVKKLLTDDDYGKIIIAPATVGSHGVIQNSVTWNVNIGTDVPRGKYVVAMKLNSVKANTSNANVPEGVVFTCTGYSRYDNTSRVVSMPALDKITVSYGGIYHSCELDVTGKDEVLELQIVNPRQDMQLELEYAYLVPMYHARVAFDAPSEYYAGETKIYDMVGGVAKRVYNINHEFKGTIMICNPFMRWHIDPKKRWYQTGDITHTQYTRDYRTAITNYSIDDPLNRGMKLIPEVFLNNYPNVVVKKIMPNVIELEIVCEDGVEGFGADTGKMVATVHVVPYAFKFYCNNIGEMYYNWHLKNVHGFPTFMYYDGSVMAKYGDDNVDSDGENDSHYVDADVSSVIANYNDYLYILSFNEKMMAHIGYKDQNLIFPRRYTKGSYQFSLSVLPLFTDRNYNYKDSLVCINNDMERKASYENAGGDVRYSWYNRNETDFWNFFEVIEGDKSYVTPTVEGFTVSHNDVYSKNMTSQRYRIQNRDFDFFKMDFDLEMNMPSASYVPKITIKAHESDDMDTALHCEIYGRTTDNVKLIVYNPSYPGGVTFTATVDLNLLSGGYDHITIVSDTSHKPGATTIKYFTKMIINGEQIVFQDSNGNDAGGFTTNAFFRASPIEFHFNMLYGCSVTVNHLKIRPYIATFQNFNSISSLALPDNTRYSIFRNNVGDVAIETNGAYKGVTIKNDGKMFLKSYKVKAGEYKFYFFKPSLTSGTTALYLNADVLPTGLANGLYITVDTTGGTYALKWAKANGAGLNIYTAVSPYGSLKQNVWYIVNVNVDDINNTVSARMYEYDTPANVVFDFVKETEAKYFKYGKIGLRQYGGPTFFDSYSFTGIEKHGRGPQIKRWMDDFDFCYKLSGSPVLKYEYNDTTNLDYTINLQSGTISDIQSPSTTTYRIIYPIGLRPYICRTEFMVRSTRDTVNNKKAGVMMNVSSFTATQSPNDGYGAFINFKNSQFDFVVYDTPGGTPTTLYNARIDKFQLVKNKWYRIVVTRSITVVIVEIYDEEGGQSQSFTINLNVPNIKKFNQNGITALAGWYGSNEYGIMFDDFVVRDIDYKDNSISVVTMGGVNHGGEYDTPTRVYNKFVPNVSIPYGYYYLVANVASTAYMTPFVYYIKNFGNNKPIVIANSDGEPVTETGFSAFANVLPEQVIKYIIRLDDTHENDKCGIEIVTYQTEEYSPTLYVNYIFGVPLSGIPGKQMFVNELNVVNKSPTVINRRLEKKRIS